MNDMIIKSAQDPSCILAVTPDRGGSWWATLRPDTPRNFAEKPMTWTSFATMIATVTETNWKFSIAYTLNSSDGTQRIFTGGSNAGPIAVFKSSDGLLYIRTVGGNGTIIQANPEGDFSGSHIVEIIAENGLYEIKYDGETVRAVHDVATTPVLIHGDEISSQFNGTIDSAGFLCGDVVWQASHDDLFETNNPWPSPVPRNFAEEPMTWTEFSPDKITINTQHDYEFLIQFSSNGQLPPTDNETQLFYSTDNKMLAGVWIAKDGQIRGYLSVYEFNALMIHEIGEPALSAGIHTIRILAVGNTMSAYLDDELVNSAVRNRRTDFSEITSCPISSFDGNLLCAKLTDLTTGRTVWSYPSEAERVRLLTKTNVRTDRGAFEAADTTKSAAIATQLTDTPQTFLVFDEDGELLNNVTIPNGVFTIPAGTKIRALLGFDRALTAAEIAALTPKQA